MVVRSWTVLIWGWWSENLVLRKTLSMVKTLRLEEPVGVLDTVDDVQAS
jgi:hypothetical protein